MSSLWNWVRKTTRGKKDVFEIRKRTSSSPLSPDVQKDLNELTSGKFMKAKSPKCPSCGLVVPDQIHSAMALAGMKPGDMVGTKCSECGTHYVYPQPSI
jgi:uncharacterized OB-fold protein